MTSTGAHATTTRRGALAFGTYVPVWRDPAGRPVTGFDEDILTAAVQSAAALLRGVDGPAITRIVCVTDEPDFLAGGASALIPLALALDPETPVTERLGGGLAALDELTSAPGGTLVLGVQGSGRVGASATLVAQPGSLVALARRAGTAPSDVRLAFSSDRYVYGDSRLIREQVWRPVVAEATAAGDRVLAVGLPPKDAISLGADTALTTELTVDGAAGALRAVALLGRAGGGRVVAVENGSSLVVQVPAAEHPWMRDERPGLLLTERLGPPADIPISLPGHLRNLVAKVGFSGSRCGKCDTLDYPTRYQCSSCGAADAGTMERLPTTGTVYTVVTVRVPVPGLSSPYSIAVVDLDGEELRVLARVTGTTPGDVAIGERGRFLLRRIATRTGVPDYAGSFQTGEDQPVPYEGAQS